MRCDYVPLVCVRLARNSTKANDFGEADVVRDPKNLSSCDIVRV